jgi:hypothetical protein
MPCCTRFRIKSDLTLLFLEPGLVTGLRLNVTFSNPGDPNNNDCGGFFGGELLSELAGRYSD